MQCDGLFGTTEWSRPPNEPYINWRHLVGSMTTAQGIVISEDVLGQAEKQDAEFHFWSSVPGIMSLSAMVYTEAGGDTTQIQGFDTSLVGGNVWDSCLDYDVVTHYAPLYNNNIIVNARSFADFPDPRRPFRTHLEHTMTHSAVPGVCFEVATNVAYLHLHQIADGINAVTDAGKDVYLLLSRGADPTKSYTACVLDVVSYLDANQVDLVNNRLHLVVAAYDRKSSGVEFFISQGGENSVESALERLILLRADGD
jgi:hypothetical protein